MTHTAKHTPGPWVVQRHDPNNSRYHSNVVRNWSENGKHYTRSITIQLAYDESAVNDANANLIAAAPAMYAWIAKVCKDGLSFEDIKEGRALLSQAEGIDHA